MVDHTKTREDCARYFGLSGSEKIPERAVVVPILCDAFNLGEYLTDFEYAFNRHLPNIGVCKGKYKGAPVTMLVCGIGSWTASESMDAAGLLGFEKALFFGSCGAIDEGLERGDFVVTTRAYESMFNEKICPDDVLPETMERVKGAYADREVILALERELGKRGIPFRKGETYSTDAEYRQEEVMLEALRKRGYLALDREHRTVLDGFSGDRTKAGALMYVTDRIGKETPSTTNYWVFAKECLETCYPVVFDALVSD